MDVVLLGSLAMSLCWALLFTNAVEWLGLGKGAVGSLLAAVGTAMPETLIAIVALPDATAGAEQVAIGAIGAGLGLAAVCSPTQCSAARRRFGQPAVVAWFALYGSFIVIVVNELRQRRVRPAL